MSERTVLVAEDDPGIRLVVSQTLTAAGYTVRATGSPDALQRWVRNGEGDVVVTDVYMGDTAVFELLPSMKLDRPDLPFIVMSGNNTILTAAAAAEHGAFDYLAKPFDIEVLSGLVERALKKPGGDRKVQRGAAQAEESATLPLIGRSEEMQDVYRIISRVMNTDLTVLIDGEAGTGKELAARAIHKLGDRSDRPFTALDLSTMEPDRVARELFGDDGAGGSAVQQGATVYLDEVGDLTPEAQAQLVRLMREVDDVRLIASTRRDLPALVEAGEFREDLYYRLNVVRLTMPPLRRRKQDIPELAKAFLIRAQRRGLPEKTFEPAAMDLVAAFDWPGNVRELENLVMRLAALSPDATISAREVEREMRGDQLRAAGSAGGFEKDVELLLNRYVVGELITLDAEGGSQVYASVIERVERPLISLALSVTSGNKVRAASLLGLNRNTLRAKINALGIAED
ncbi:MAG: sigma-54 dependent transcriptional regulator [Pseudomonadota bacterium]